MNLNCIIFSLSLSLSLFLSRSNYLIQQYRFDDAERLVVCSAKIKDDAIANQSALLFISVPGRVSVNQVGTREEKEGKTLGFYRSASAEQQPDLFRPVCINIRHLAVKSSAVSCLFYLKHS